jgi:hypothetical protein
MSKVIPYLLRYNSLKRKNKLKPEHLDISQVKNIDQLMDLVDEYQEENTSSRSEKEKYIEQQFYNSGEADLEIKVVVPKSERASCYFGRSTRCGVLLLQEVEIILIVIIKKAFFTLF